MHYVTKRYGHNLGLSACFRQWRASSHCRFLHGYALAFQFIFAARELDENGWVIDFGGLKEIKEWLVQTFDHKTIVAEDDPKLAHFYLMQDEKMIDLLVVPRVGIEAFSALAGGAVSFFIQNKKDLQQRGVRLIEVECSEHEGNSASWAPDFVEDEGIEAQSTTQLYINPGDL